MMRRRAWWLSLAFLTVTSASAAGPSEGETLFREGRAAMQARDFERACAKFAESQRKEPAPGTALNLGECEEQRGHLVAASEAFTMAASMFTTLEKQRYAAGRAEGLDRRVPRIIIHASTAIPGLLVRIGPSAAIIDTEIKVDPGEIVIRAEAPHRRPKELHATLRESRSFEFDIGPLEPEAPAIEPPPPSPVPAAREPDRKATLRTVGIVLGSVGLASLVVGGVTGVLALNRASTVQDHCNADLACDREGLDAAQSGETLSLVSTITVAAGAAAVVSGAILYFVVGRRPRGTGALASSLALIPVASPLGTALSLRGAF